MRWYILVSRDDHYKLIGPFDSQAEAAEWGKDPKNNPRDDPRWQTIELSSPYAIPRVLGPTFNNMES